MAIRCNPTVNGSSVYRTPLAASRVESPIKAQFFSRGGRVGERVRADSGSQRGESCPIYQVRGSLQGKGKVRCVVNYECDSAVGRARCQTENRRRWQQVGKCNLSGFQ